MHNFLFKSGALGCAVFSTIQYSYAEVDEPVYELAPFLVSAGPGYRSVDNFATPASVLAQVSYDCRLWLINKGGRAPRHYKIDFIS